MPPDRPDSAGDPPPHRPDPERGLFETLLVRDGRAQALEAHLARLERSARDLYGVALPEPARARVAEALSRPAPGRGDERARIDATPEAGRLRLSLTITEPPRPGPVALAPLVVPGGLGGHKWQDRRLVEAATTGAAVPLIVDADGSVLEAAWANVWLLEGEDRLVTPPADGRLLPGVTRARLLRIAPALGLDAVEGQVTLAELATGDGILVTSSVRLAAPATLAAGAAPSPRINEIAPRIQAALRTGD